jgi:cytochrome P450
MQGVTLEVILRAVFGVTDEQRRARLTERLPRLLGETSSLGLQARVMLSSRFGRGQPMRVLEEVVGEIDELLLAEIAERRVDPDPTQEREDDYMRAVISESLRLRPVVPLAGRRLAVALEAGEVRLPAGTDVTPAIWLTHTREDLYPEPFLFRPERFLEQAPVTYGWIPFGGGVRRCLGAAFAEFEMKMVLETVLRRQVLEPVGARAEAIARRNVTFSPRNGTLVRSSPRSAPATGAEPDRVLVA